MAEKRFYDFIETCQRLGKTQEEVQALIRAGKLNPLRSGQRGTMNFRVEEVNNLVLGGGKSDDFEFMDELAEVESSPSDALTIESGGDVGLSESIGLGLNPEDEDLGLSESFLPPGTEPVATVDEGEVIASEPQGSDTGEELPLSSESFGFSTDEVDAIQESPTQAETASQSETATQQQAETVAEPTEDDVPRISPTLGGSDVIDIEEIDAGAAAAAAADDTVITQVGINVFDDREVEVDSDPLADTVITPSAEDQVQMEGAGSGSGLLDLSREDDETSFGEVLQDISGGEAGSTFASEVASAESDAGAISEIEEAEEVEEVVGPVEMPIFGATAREIEAPDPAAPMYTWFAAMGFLVMGAATFVMAMSLRGLSIELIEKFEGSIVYGGVVVLLAVFAVAVPIFLLARGKAARQRAFQELQG